MTETKFTPGPWEIDSYDELDGMPYIEICAQDQDGFKPIAQVQPSPDGDENFVLLPEDEHNAHLIAAATEMYELLDRTLLHLKQVEIAFGIPGVGDVNLQKQIEDLLKEARGES